MSHTCKCGGNCQNHKVPAHIKKQLEEYERFVEEWKTRFGFLAIENDPKSIASIDEVANILNENIKSSTGAED